MAFVDLKVDPKYHRHIIGKGGANGKCWTLLLLDFLELSKTKCDFE